jgi:hypothetical protein
MCFSATASFVTAGITGVIGIVSLTRARPREWPLAATPLLFAAQQGVEGLLWLVLPLAPEGAPEGALARGLTFAFLLFAEMLWPVYAPVAVLLIEPDAWRRRLMLLCLALGAGVAGYLGWRVLLGPHGAAIMDDHIVYVTAYRHSDAVGLAYLAATALPLLLSSRRTVAVVGGIVLVGSAVAYATYWEAFVSVWCFFAAAASAVILCHFVWLRRQRLNAAA